MTQTVERLLAEAWEDDPGAPGFFSTVDHKRLGMRYVATAFAFFLVAGLLALVMRTQLAVPDNGLVGPELYNRLFTLHGTTMIFLFNTPVLIGIGTYLMPLMIGARDLAFPRLNAFAYWVYVLSGMFLYASVLVGQVPDAGWFAYVPLSSRLFSQGAGLTFWALGVVFTGISTTAGGVNFIVTAFKLRAPGMTAARTPVFVWAFVVTSFMILFAVPAITLAPLLLAFDRLVGTAFYDVARGGDVLLYQHLFWFWGHPEVYILFLPAIGMVSTMLPAFTRRPLAGYTWAVASLVAVGFVSFGVWVHHMFAVGLPVLATSFFSAAGLVITFPTAVQVFVWIATLWSGQVRWRHPSLLFILAFIVTFVIGGITGVMVSVIPFDWQVTDSYFVVAHLHYVLIGGVVFPIFAAAYYWLPKATGWLLDERLGQVSVCLMFVGFHVAFFPMHLLGLLGMPRRVYEYAAGLGWGGHNLVATAGAFLLASGVGVSIANLGVSWRRRRPAGANPWAAGTLEWATSSPPAVYNFAAMPMVDDIEPLWHAAPLRGTPLAPPDHEHQTVRTAEIDAHPEVVMSLPRPSYWPLVLALAVLAVFVGLLLRSVPLGIVGLVMAVTSLAAWQWAQIVAGNRGGDG